MTDSPARENRFSIEMLKLMLQVIMSDGQLAPEELQYFTNAARQWNVPDAEASALIGCLQQGTPLPAPDMSVLRAHPDAVLDAARALVASDQQIDSAEIDMLKQIRELLSS